MGGAPPVPPGPSLTLGVTAACIRRANSRSCARREPTARPHHSTPPRRRGGGWRVARASLGGAPFLRRSCRGTNERTAAPRRRAPPLLRDELRPRRHAR